MNKLVIFDLDGVLIDSRDIHFETLNDALKKIDEKFVINRDEHLSLYDGLSTTKKLEMLTKNKNLPVEFYNQIWEDKQKRTIEIFSNLDKDSQLISFFRKLKSLDLKIAVASNSIRNTVKTALLNLGILEYIDYFISNEDVKRPKPFPEMYWQCMVSLNALPKNTVIIEDSHIGRQGAIDSGAHLIHVENK